MPLLTYSSSVEVTKAEIDQAVSNLLNQSSRFRSMYNDLISRGYNLNINITNGNPPRLVDPLTGEPVPEELQDTYALFYAASSNSGTIAISEQFLSEVN